MDSEIFKRNAFDLYVQGKVIFGGGVPRFVANRHFNSSSMLGLYTVNALACIPVSYTHLKIALKAMYI